jgi:hypothetical protein
VSGSTGPLVAHQAPVSPRRRGERDLPSPWWGLVILLALAGTMALAAYGAYWVWQHSAPADVIVPKVAGMPRVAAEGVLRAKGLVPRISGERHSETVPEDVVIEARPKDGRVVKQGRAVDLLVSLGSAYTKVPDLRKMSESQARGALRNADLAAAERQQWYDSAIPEGHIISQRPVPGTRVPRGSGVQLRVSLGPAPGSAASGSEPGAGEDRSEPRYLRVEAVTPDDSRDHRVRIVLWDYDGERVAYDKVRGPGVTVTRRVRGVGMITVQVFVDEDLVEQKTL